MKISIFKIQKLLHSQTYPSSLPPQLLFLIFQSLIHNFHYLTKHSLDENDVLIMNLLINVAGNQVISNNFEEISFKVIQFCVRVGLLSFNNSSLDRSKTDNLRS